MKNKNIIRIMLGAALFLLVPLSANLMSDEFNWTLFDLIFVYILLTGSGLTYELVARRFKDNAYRAGVGVAVLTVLLLVWVNGAVGIIGDGPVNMLYLGVPATGALGALVARFRPRGMVRTLFATAFVQALVPVIALVVWGSEIGWTPGVLPVFILNSFFVALFVASALLFRRVARHNGESLER